MSAGTHRSRRRRRRERGSRPKIMNDPWRKGRLMPCGPPTIRRVSFGFDRKACPFSSPSNPSCVLLFASPVFVCRYLYEKTRSSRTIGPVSPLAPRNPGDHVTRCGSSLPYREYVCFCVRSVIIPEKNGLKTFFCIFTLLLCCYGARLLDIRDGQWRRREDCIAFRRLRGGDLVAVYVVNTAGHAQEEPEQGDHGYGE